MERDVPTGWAAFKLSFRWTSFTMETAEESANALGHARFLKHGGAVLQSLWTVGIVALVQHVWLDGIDGWVLGVFFVVLTLSTYWHARRLERRAVEALRGFEQRAAQAREPKR